MIQDSQMLEEPSYAAPPSFQTAEEFAYQALRTMILDCVLTGGTRLNQDDLARRLNISRTPIRQAVLRLEHEGLVVNRPNRGATVTILGPAAMLELFEMRSVLEGLALSLAVPNIDAPALEEMESQLAKLDSAQSDITLWIQLHDDFHSSIFRHARRPRLTAQLHRLRQSVAPYLRLYLTTNEFPEMPGNEHRSLIEAIRSRDSSAAEANMRDHVMSAAQGVVEFVCEQGAQRRKESP